MNPSIYKAKLFDLPAWCTLNPAFLPKMPDKGNYVPSAPVVPTLQPGKHIFVPKRIKRLLQSLIYSTCSAKNTNRYKIQPNIQRKE